MADDGMSNEETTWVDLLNKLTITRRIVVVLGDGEPLHLTVVDDHGMTLAAADDTDGGWSRVGHLHIELLGELGGRVAHEADVGSLNLLVLAPSLHDSSVCTKQAKKEESWCR